MYWNMPYYGYSAGCGSWGVPCGWDSWGFGGIAAIAVVLVLILLFC